MNQMNSGTIVLIFIVWTIQLIDGQNYSIDYPPYYHQQPQPPYYYQQQQQQPERIFSSSKNPYNNDRYKPIVGASSSSAAIERYRNLHHYRHHQKHLNGDADDDPHPRRPPYHSYSTNTNLYYGFSSQQPTGEYYDNKTLNDDNDNNNDSNGFGNDWKSLPPSSSGKILRSIKISNENRIDSDDLLLTSASSTTKTTTTQPVQSSTTSTTSTSTSSTTMASSMIDHSISSNSREESASTAMLLPFNRKINLIVRTTKRVYFQIDNNNRRKKSKFSDSDDEDENQNLISLTIMPCNDVNNNGNNGINLEIYFINSKWMKKFHRKRRKIGRRSKEQLNQSNLPNPNQSSNPKNFHLNKRKFNRNNNKIKKQFILKRLIRKRSTLISSKDFPVPNPNQLESGLYIIQLSTVNHGENSSSSTSSLDSNEINVQIYLNSRKDQIYPYPLLPAMAQIETRQLFPRNPLFSNGSSSVEIFWKPVVPADDDNQLDNVADNNSTLLEYCIIIQEDFPYQDQCLMDLSDQALIPTTSTSSSSTEGSIDEENNWWQKTKKSIEWNNQNNNQQIMTMMMNSGGKRPLTIECSQQTRESNQTHVFVHGLRSNQLYYVDVFVRYIWWPKLSGQSVPLLSKRSSAAASSLLAASTMNSLLSLTSKYSTANFTLLPYDPMGDDHRKRKSMMMRRREKQWEIFQEQKRRIEKNFLEMKKLYDSLFMGVFLDSKNNFRQKYLYEYSYDGTIKNQNQQQQHKLYLYIQPCTGRGPIQLMIRKISRFGQYLLMKKKNRDNKKNMKDKLRKRRNNKRRRNSIFSKLSSINRENSIDFNDDEMMKEETSNSNSRRPLRPLRTSRFESDDLYDEDELYDDEDDDEDYYYDNYVKNDDYGDDDNDADNDVISNEILLFEEVTETRTIEVIVPPPSSATSTTTTNNSKIDDADDVDADDDDAVVYLEIELNTMAMMIVEQPQQQQQQNSRSAVLLASNNLNKFPFPRLPKDKTIRTMETLRQCNSITLVWQASPDEKVTYCLLQRNARYGYSFDDDDSNKHLCEKIKPPVAAPPQRRRPSAVNRRRSSDDANDEDADADDDEEDGEDNNNEIADNNNNEIISSIATEPTTRRVLCRRYRAKKRSNNNLIMQKIRRLMPGRQYIFLVTIKGRHKNTLQYEQQWAETKSEDQCQMEQQQQQQQQQNSRRRRYQIPLN